MNENNNRPRVVRINGKSVIIRPESTASGAAGQEKTSNQESKPARQESTTARKESKPVAKKESTGRGGTSFADFIISLRYKRSIVAAVIIIALLSVTVSLFVPVFMWRASGEQDEVKPDFKSGDEVNIVSPGTESPSPVVDTELAVCIDPGHGFDDIGTSNEVLGVYEYIVNLNVGLALRDKLEAAGVKVYLTHDTNEPPADAGDPYLFGMKKRNGLANSLSDVGLFISLHCDTYDDDTTIYGPRVYHMAKDKGGKEVADFISSELSTLAGKEVYVKAMSGYNSYQVLRDSDMPAVLVEMGFLSNPEEGAAMKTPEWTDAMAGSLADAIIASVEDGVIGE